MSLSSIKNKESKGKRNVLPKLKTILANPYKTKLLSLDSSELEKLFQILNLAIKESGLSPRSFTNAKHFCIGLESVLRSINNGRVSCVFLSLSIKPRHVLELVAQSVQVKCPTAPVYTQSQLEQYTDKLFGIRAIAFSMPQSSEELCTELKEWINTRKINIYKTQLRKDTFKRHTQKKGSEFNTIQIDAVEKGETSDKIQITEKPDWSDDFISFSSSSSATKKAENLEQDKSKLFEVLHQMTGNVKLNNMEVNLCENIVGSGVLENKEDDMCVSQSHDSDEFLNSYKPLKVHKINPNPAKKPKKKRKKIRS